MCEQLEHRVLLTGDLAVSIGTSTVPPALRTGVVTRGTLKLQLTNTTTDAFTSSTPRINVEVRLVANGTNQSTLIGTVRNVSLARLALGTTRTVTASVAIPSSLPEGTYRLVASADPSNALLEDDPQRANNSQGLVTDIPVRSPFSDIRIETVNFAPSTTTSPASTTRLPSPGTATVIIRNYGNTTARGTLDLRLLATTQGLAAATELADLPNRRISLASGRTLTLVRALPLTTPINTNLQQSLFSIVAQITPTVTPANLQSTAPLQASAATRLTLPSSGRSPTSPLVAGLGRSLTFTATTVTPSTTTPGLFTETGTFTDELSHAGSYTWTYLNSPSNTLLQGQLALALSPRQRPLPLQQPLSARFELTFTSTQPPSLSTRRLTFGSTPTGPSTPTGQARNNNITTPGSPTDPGVPFLLEPQAVS